MSREGVVKLVRVVMGSGKKKDKSSNLEEKQRE